MKKYAAYGLLFESVFDLHPLKPLDTKRLADVSIRRAAVAKEGLTSPKVSRALAQIDDETVWMNLPKIGRLQVSKGSEIFLDPEEGVDEQTLRLYIMGSAMGAILHQRGHLVLHANAIRVGEGVVLFAGISGSGKSTTAAAFHQKGFEVISDDVVALDVEGRILGGFPQIKLWKDALEKLNIPSDDLNRIRSQINKYSFPIDHSYSEQCHPIRAIYILTTANSIDPDQFKIEPLEGLQKFNALKQHTYRRHFMEGLGLKQAHLKLCGELANGVYMGHIIRPTGRFNAPELADYVLKDLENESLHNPE